MAGTPFNIDRELLRRGPFIIVHIHFCLPHLCGVLWWQEISNSLHLDLQSWTSVTSVWTAWMQQDKGTLLVCKYLCECYLEMFFVFLETTCLHLTSGVPLLGLLVFHSSQQDGRGLDSVQHQRVLLHHPLGCLQVSWVCLSRSNHVLDSDREH